MRTEYIVQAHWALPPLTKSEFLVTDIERAISLANECSEKYGSTKVTIEKVTRDQIYLYTPDSGVTEKTDHGIFRSEK